MTATPPDDILEVEPEFLIVVEEQVQGAEETEGKGQSGGDNSGKNEPLLPSAGGLFDRLCVFHCIQNPSFHNVAFETDRRDCVDSDCLF